MLRRPLWAEKPWWDWDEDSSWSSSTRWDSKPRGGHSGGKTHTGFLKLSCFVKAFVLRGENDLFFCVVYVIFLSQLTFNEDLLAIKDASDMNLKTKENMLQVCLGRNPTQDWTGRNPVGHSHILSTFSKCTVTPIGNHNPNPTPKPNRTLLCQGYLHVWDMRLPAAAGYYSFKAGPSKIPRRN